MSKGVKIGCAVVAALFLLAGIVCGSGFVFARGWFLDVGEEYKAQQPQITAEAREVAKGGPDACVVEGLKRSAMCDQFGIKCRVDATIRTNACLEFAPVTPTFCAGVPAETAVWDVSKWGMGECARRGYGDDDQCPQFMARTVAKRCGQL